MDFEFWDCLIFGIWNLDFGCGETSPDRPGEPAGDGGGTARPGSPNAFLYRESKNPFRQAWLGKNVKWAQSEEMFNVPNLKDG